MRIRAEIDHAALRHNACAVKDAVGPDTGLIAVVKADGYGHGAAEVARTLAPFAAKFGVATLDEARGAFRRPGSRHPAAQSVLPAERTDAVSENFIPSCPVRPRPRAYASSGSGHPVRVHLGIDTGMGRIGIWQDDAVATRAKSPPTRAWNSNAFPRTCRLRTPTRISPHPSWSHGPR